MNYLKILLGTSFLCFAFYACSVQKRHFRPGYYVNWNNPNSSKKELTRINKIPDEKNTTRVKETARQKNGVEKIFNQTIPEGEIAEKSNEKQRELSKKNKHQLIEKRLNREGDCDVLVLKNGDELTVKVIEIGTEEIRYVKCDNQSGPVYVVKKSTAFMVKFANGSKEVFTARETPPNTYSQKNYNPNGQKAGNPKTDALGVISFFGVIVSLFVPFPLGLFVFVGFYAMAIVSLVRIKNNPDEYKGKGWGISALLLPLIILLLALLLLILLI